MWARNGRWILPEMPDFHAAFRNLLHAVNLRHGTDGFTSPPKEGVLRIFSSWKIRPCLNPRTCVPKASTLPLDHRSRLDYRLTDIVTVLYTFGPLLHVLLISHLFSSLIVFRIFKWRKIRWEGMLHASGEEMCIQGVGRDSWRKEISWNTGVDGMIVLKRIFKERV